jgi:hypothetical protein
MNEPRIIGAVGPKAVNRRPVLHRIGKGLLKGLLIGLVTLNGVFFACVVLHALWDVLNGLHNQGALWVLVCGAVLAVWLTPPSSHDDR